MKDILVEFTDYGAVVHKDPAVIELKKDMPDCFLNPDLSAISGISPSYWDYNEAGQIVPASPEERKKRDEFHTVPVVNSGLNLSEIKEEYIGIKEELLALQQSLHEIKNINKESVMNLSMDLSAAFSSIDEVNDKLNELKVDVDNSVENLHDISNQIINSLDAQSFSLNNDIEMLKNNNKLLEKFNNSLKIIEEKIEDNKAHCETISDLISINLNKQETQIKHLKLFLFASVILTIILKVI